MKVQQALEGGLLCNSYAIASEKQKRPVSRGVFAGACGRITQLYLRCAARPHGWRC